jgi:hypothetical protein
MKIARIIARLNVGGPARHVVWLTRGLQDEEFQSILLTGTVPEGEQDMSWFAEENGVAPRYIPEMSRELSPKDAVSLWKIYQEFRREKPDIIHTDLENSNRQTATGQICPHFSRSRFSQLLQPAKNQNIFVD